MRIAIFFTPPADHPLTEAAALWLGRDAFTGEARPQAPVAGFRPGEIGDLTADPRRYGFHATLKPPFRVAEGRTADELRASVARFGAARGPVRIEALRLARLGPFFALTPDGPSAALDAFAADVVESFDAFRKPPSPEEIERRRPERLTPRQRDYLKAWGYPYVFEEFRFHMTLTGPVPANRQEAMAEVLAERFAAFIGRPLDIDALTLFAEHDPPADFVVDTRVPLTPAFQPMDIA